MKTCIELELIDWLRQRQGPARSVALGIGDDMAVVHSDAMFHAVSSDMLLDGVHFDTKTQDLSMIGRKAVACCLSDCAAMAVRPVSATISIALPNSMNLREVKTLFDGMFAISEEFDLAIVGGDTTRWQHPMAIDIAIHAEPFPTIDPITRAGAREGDRVYVTGKLGGSGLRRHLSFTPRVHEARKLAECLGSSLHAMIDISDGLCLDLWRLCQASRVGAIVEEGLALLVIHDDAKEAADADERTALEHALHDGEDFELLLAVDANRDVRIDQATPIGHIANSGLSFSKLDGSVTTLEPKGYVH